MISQLDDVCEFLSAHPPFDLLPADVVAGLAPSIEIMTAAAGTAVVTMKQRIAHLYLVRSGKVELRGPGEEVLAQRIDGETFGIRALLSDGYVGFRAIAIDDSTIYRLPDWEFARLRLDYPEFARFFTPLGGASFRLAHADDRLSSESQPNLIALRMSDLMTPEPATIGAERTIREAAQLMREQRISCLPVTSGGALTGILTTVDLRDRVVAEGMPPQTPVAEVMTREPVTLDAESLAYDALSAMREHMVRHLPVLRDGQLVGIVSDTDVLRRQLDYPGYLSGSILRRNTPAAVAQVVAQIPQLLVMLVETGATARTIGIIVSSIADVTTFRLLQLAEERLGPPPVPYAWLATGSQARQEQTGVSDQDNGLLLDDAFDEVKHGAYFTELARFVCDGLAASGYVYCPGEMMAITPRWRQPLARWKQYFAGWIDEPEPKAQMLASVMFDLRPIHGATWLFDELQAFALEKTQANSVFIAHMVSNALTHNPPLGFLGRFVLNRGGQHHRQLDLKAHGLVPIIDLARIYALKAGVSLANTRDRLVVARRAGVISEFGMHDLIDAFEFLSLVRLKHQSARIRRGEEPDNHINPSELSRIERQHLREAFIIVRTMQAAIGAIHQIRR